MESPVSERSGREVRLLVATIVVSVVALLLLAKLRFPADAVEAGEPAPAPLERLAAQASYDSLASAMADLDRRVSPTLLPVQIRPARSTGVSTVAARVAPDRAVLALNAAESLVSVDGSAPNLLFRDPRSGIAVIAVDAAADRVVTPRTGTPRPGPRYVAVAEAIDGRPSLNPVYVAGTQSREDPLIGGTVLSMTAPAQLLPRGSAVFTLAGAFVGLAVDSARGRGIVPAEMLTALAGQQSPPGARPLADFGVEVQPLSDSLSRVTGTSAGVVVSNVDAEGPAANALQPGDVIVSIDDIPVRSVAEFSAIEQSRTAGAPIPLVYVRRAQTISIRLVAREAAAAQPQPAPEGHGLTVRAVRGRGLEVTGVARGSAGAAAGLQAGDVLTSIDGRRPATVTDLDRSFAALGSDQGQTGVRRGSDQGQTGVRPGSDGGQTGVRPGSDPDGAPGLLVTVERGDTHLVVALERR